ncbi:MAG: carboxypeptidase regulatory-like domain-containing protein [Planctomycetes bacterium]|nr:carboxypeptidase regulatory-like domain-containing protein [Planctomycetota bacterium]
MRRRLILGVVLAAVLAGLAWWLVANGTTPAAPSAASPTAPVAESTQADVPTPSLAEPERVASATAATDNETHAKPMTTTVVPATVAARTATPTAAVGDVLVEGTVVDANGVGIAGARVDLMALFTYARPEVWIEAGTKSTTDAAGRFQLRGSRNAVLARTRGQSSRYLLNVRADGFAPAADTPCELGDADVLVTLAVAGRIEGRIEFTGSLGPRDVEIALEGPRATNPWSALPVVQVTDQRTFAFENLAAGAWSVVARTRARQELARVDSVVVQSGETTDDPRLAPLRVEARGTFEVSVFLPDGSPAASATVLLVRGDGWNTVSTTLGLTAPGVFLAVDEPDGITLSIEHEGLRSERLEHIRGPTRVDLKPPLVVEFEFENLPELERDGLGLALTLVKGPVAGDGRAQEPVSYSMRLLSNAKPSLALASPGNFECAWSAVDSTGSTTSRWAGVAASTVRVLDTIEPQVLRIRAPDGLWEKLAAGR